MLTDLRSYDSVEPLRSNICIIGAGPAGLAVADGLRPSGVEVLVLESGAVDAAPDAQSLGIGEFLGDPTFAKLPLSVTRHRQLGGTANIWDIRLDHTSRGVRLARLSPAELESRDGWYGSGWPVSVGELEPFYAAAQELLGVPPDGFDDDTGVVPPLPADPAVLTSDVFRFAAGEDVTSVWRSRVVAGDRTRVLVNATAVELVPDESGARVDHVVVADGTGRHFRVHADTVVVATGGVENARLLLASARERGGLANTHGLVGRTFMDHPLVRAGVLRGSRDIHARLRFYGPRNDAHGPVMGRLRTSDAELVRSQVPASAFVFLPRPRRYEPALMSQLKAMFERRDVAGLAKAATAGRVTPTVVKSVLHWRRSDWPQLSGGWPDSLPRRWTSYEVLQRCEQVPDPENRVVLSTRRDRLGVPVADVHWRWTEADVAGVVHAQHLVVGELERLGCGALELERTPEGAPLLLGGTHHHMGTTRMATEPSSGVVDADGRLFGVDNCYLVGSSLFPTSGSANPTLTIVALSLRLAEHLRRGARPGTL